MDDLDIRQQMVDRERFAPDAEEIRAAVLATGSTRSSVRSSPRRTQLLTGAVAALVVLITVAISLPRFRQTEPEASSSPPAALSGASAPSKAIPGWVGVRWNLDTVTQGGLVVPVPPDDANVLQFGGAGDVRGAGNCYTAIGQWTAVRQTLRVEPITRREHRCAPALDSANSKTVSHQNVVQDALHSLTTIGANETGVGWQSLTLQSGPYKLIYLNAGPSETSPFNSEPISTSAAPETPPNSSPASQAQTSAPAGDHP